MKLNMLPLTFVPTLDNESHHLLVDKLIQSCVSSMEDCDDLVDIKQPIPTLLHLKSKLCFILEVAKLIGIGHQATSVPIPGDK